MAHRSRLGLAATLLLITGCLSSGGGSCELFPPNGLAGNGSFNYECVGETDPECAELLEIGSRLPTRPIARTARFKITFPKDPTKTVKAASANAVSGIGTFTALRAGRIGFFVEALDGTDAIEDAIRLDVADPESVRIVHVGPSLFGDGNKIFMSNTERFGVAAFEKQAALAGTVPGSWSVEPEGIVDVDTGATGVVTLHPLAPGKFRLSVKAAGLEDSLSLEVAEGIPGYDAGPDADIDASADGSNDANIDGGSTDASQD